MSRLIDTAKAVDMDLPRLSKANQDERTFILGLACQAERIKATFGEGVENYELRKMYLDELKRISKDWYKNKGVN